MMKRIIILCDFAFEDAEVIFPQLRSAEDGAKVDIVSTHPSGTKLTGKHGYPVSVTVQLPKDLASVQDASIADPRDRAAALVGGAFDALIIPGGFCPDYLRRSASVLALVSWAVAGAIPVAAICHGPWLLCSAPVTWPPSPDAATSLHGLRRVISGRRATCFAAIVDDVLNAGGFVVHPPSPGVAVPADSKPATSSVASSSADPPISETVVVDGVIITAQKPEDGPAMMTAVRRLAALSYTERMDLEAAAKDAARQRMCGHLKAAMSQW
eukprot:TRINITY_DN12208_c0_g1_i1.p1 TRINITY_DN12208_c0_g1~~TRINITY_DN12208_c0_g1_i1.p1  ORF type:complete len:269 (-),score=15.77 TRINITY_DN12208_c0_g1_i1:403-1209(-)